MSKGFNRGLGTLSAGALALAMGELSQLAGEWEEVIVVTGIFTTGLIFGLVSCLSQIKMMFVSNFMSDLCQDDLHFCAVQDFL